MKAKLFIDRPILAACISALILMLGIIGLVNLPMEQYPDIAPPTVQVSANLYGRKCRNCAESGYRATGGRNQWCGKYDVHDFHGL